MAVYALLLLVFLALVEWGFHTSQDVAVQDADIVYCLAPAHLDGLVNGAVSLGLAGGGSSPGLMHVNGQKMSLAQWRTADSAEFKRACDAYATAAMPAPAPAAQSTATQAVLDILLPVLAGALLTLAADDFKQASDRRWAEADELRADGEAFTSAVQSYLRERQNVLAESLPSTSDLDAKRRALVATLRKIRSQHRKSPTIRSLQDKLDGKLGPSITENWDGKDSRAKQITDCLGTFGTSLEKVAGALERRIWLSRKL